MAPLIERISHNVTFMNVESYWANLYNPEIEKAPKLVQKILKQKLVENLNLDIRRQLIQQILIILRLYAIIPIKLPFYLKKFLNSFLNFYVNFSVSIEGLHHFEKLH